MTQKERLQALSELRNPMSSVLKSVTMLKGDTGDIGPAGKDGKDGYTPKKGYDYFTDSEIQAIINYIQSNVKDGEVGAIGPRGPQGPIGETPNVDKLIKEVLSKIPKQAPIPTAQEIIKQIKLPETSGFVTESKLAEFLRRGGFRGGGLSTVSTDATLTGDGTASNPLSVVASGGGFTILPATGTIDDTNVTFTFTQAPTLVNINGSFYNAGATSGGTVMWTAVGTTYTLANPVGTGGCLFGII